MISQKRKNEIEQKVNDILKNANIDEAPVDLMKILNNEKINLYKSDLSKYDGRELSGLIEKVDDELRIVVNKNHASTRNAFTVAHEFGHYALGHMGKNGITTSYRETNGIKTAVEHEANYFSVCLLMPESIMKKYEHEYERNFILPTITDYANKFKVSTRTMRIRLKELGMPFYGF